jgi:hypothetical protein
VRRRFVLFGDLADNATSSSIAPGSYTLTVVVDRVQYPTFKLFVGNATCTGTETDSFRDHYCPGQYEKEPPCFF